MTSALEAAKRISRPLFTSLKPSSVTEDVIKVQKKLAARRNLIEIVRYTTFSPSNLRAGKPVQVYVSHFN